ncbi:MAG: class I SAM-dependent methyltransferase, partial [Gammaproteobacteria bacterium]
MHDAGHCENVAPTVSNRVKSASLLERMIDRLVAQRSCLRYAASMVLDLPGPVLEVGLGKGRTYDYLRTLFPDREIFAFDRTVHALENCTPDPDHLILGELRQTLPDALRHIGTRAALVHADIGSTDPSIDQA